MSLDVYLEGDLEDVPCECECGHKHTKTVSEMYFHQSITHNLGKMAAEAEIYKACWRPEEIGAKQAKDILPILKRGYFYMKAYPDRLKKFDSPNGWGLYANFLPWVKRYIEACEKFPESYITVSR